jgi:hypothetical protein
MDDPALLSVQVYRSEAYQIYLRLHTFALNHFVFARNYEELRKLLVAAQSPDVFYELWTQDKAEEMHKVTRELIRLFHNFLASAKTLVDHTRTLINDYYEGTNFLTEYQTEVNKRFVDNSLTGFIEDLRNYALHYQLPFTGARFKPADGEDAQRFILHTDQLLNWSKWTVKGKPFLETAGEEIIVLDLVDEYFRQVNGFHEWMKTRLEEIHADDLAWLDEMQRRVQTALAKLRPRDA